MPGSTAMHHRVAITRVAGLQVQLDRDPSTYSTSTSSFWQGAAASATMGFLLSVRSCPPGFSLDPFTGASCATCTQRSVVEPCWQNTTAARAPSCRRAKAELPLSDSLRTTN